MWFIFANILRSALILNRVNKKIRKNISRHSCIWSSSFLGVISSNLEKLFANLQREFPLTNKSLNYWSFISNWYYDERMDTFLMLVRHVWMVYDAHTKLPITVSSSPLRMAGIVLYSKVMNSSILKVLRINRTPLIKYFILIPFNTTTQSYTHYIPILVPAIVLPRIKTYSNIYLLCTITGLRIIINHAICPNEIEEHHEFYH